LDRLDAADAGNKVRRHAEFRSGAKTWKTDRRVIARFEASGQGVDSHFIVTNLTGLPKSVRSRMCEVDRRLTDSCAGQRTA
jgi:hypothetical protein